jgi:hypothetical protein
MTVRILDRELVGPAEIAWRAFYACVPNRELGKEHIGIVNTDPEPNAWDALLAFAQQG